jgi:hypothetical protein
LEKAETWLDHWERGEDQSEGMGSKETNGRSGDLSSAVGRKVREIRGSRKYSMWNEDRKDKLI